MEYTQYELFVDCGHSNITYSIQGDEASRAGFGINERTGEVFRKSELASLGITQFNLRYVLYCITLC